MSCIIVGSVKKVKKFSDHNYRLNCCVHFLPSFWLSKLTVTVVMTHKCTESVIPKQEIAGLLVNLR